MKSRIIIFGGSGFVGLESAKYFKNAGHEVIIVSRSSKNSLTFETWLWDGKTLGEWADKFQTSDVIINLAGYSINCVHNEKNRKLILDSRIDSVDILNKAISQSKTPPQLYIQAGSLAMFNNTGILSDENAPTSIGFTAEVSLKWEEAFYKTKLANTRQVFGRFGFILGKNGGAYPMLIKLTKSFLGGAAGSGKQYLSWIHIEDVIRIFEYCMATEISGSINVCNPSPSSNKDFMKALRESVGRPWCPPAPAFMIKIIAKHILKTAPSLILDSTKAKPSALLNHGFKFKHSEINRVAKELATK
jgi:uncharacterized protein (TIGR01777 family)